VVTRRNGAILPPQVLVQVHRTQNRATGPDLDDRDGGEAEVEVPEVRRRKAEKGADGDSEDSAVSDDQRPARALMGRIRVTEDLVSIQRSAGRPIGQLRQDHCQRGFDTRSDLLETFAAGRVEAGRPAPPRGQRLAEAALISVSVSPSHSPWAISRNPASGRSGGVARPAASIAPATSSAVRSARPNGEWTMAKGGVSGIGSGGAA